MVVEEKVHQVVQGWKEYVEVGQEGTGVREGLGRGEGEAQVVASMVPETLAAVLVVVHVWGGRELVAVAVEAVAVEVMVVSQVAPGQVGQVVVVGREVAARVGAVQVAP
uniref:Uncharacterized protein n=1 Tax=Chlamydomonas leiostraca TaxID=1034604 RepID=A0A7S0RE05_9CHLO|mmetsp:Transcript_2049/g.5220  ORF Transcript_2049/g.5220 Transcript_2049/m.5220 type:complete len:109 (+) Transcript_2049:94-420(+)